MCRYTKCIDPAYVEIRSAMRFCTYGGLHLASGPRPEAFTVSDHVV
jgi:hypothetical protein